MKLNKAKGIFKPFISDPIRSQYIKGDSWTHVKEIANTGLLVSLHHNYNQSANLEVFDVSRKGQTKKIYSFEEISGSRIIIN